MSTAAAASVAERNAANAQHSTGPVTAEGKNRSSQNALRHGLTARTVVLPHEDHAEYDELKAAFIEQYQPGTPVEMNLLTRMLDCCWRLQRALRVETEFYEQRGNAITEANSDLTGDAALAMMFVDPAESRSFRLFLRYLTNAQNAYRSACAEYQQTRKARVQREIEASMVEAMLDARRNEYTPEEVEEEELGEPAETDSAQSPETEPSAPAAPSPVAKPESGFVSHRSLATEVPRPFPGLPRPKEPADLAA